eukprot:COSAG02_NODE_1552_length_11961_cov_12.233182_11_plen_48_part_00
MKVITLLSNTEILNHATSIYPGGRSTSQNLYSNSRGALLSFLLLFLS